MLVAVPAVAFAVALDDGVPIAVFADVASVAAANIVDAVVFALEVFAL